MATKFIADPSGIRQLVTGEAMQDMLLHKVADALDTAQQLAMPHRETGAYIDSLFAASGEEGGFAVGRLGNTSGHAGFVEFGTSVMAAQAILRRAAEMTWSG